MTRIVFATFFVAVTLAHAQQNIPDGMPFGHVGDADIDGLQEFALKRGFDLKAEVARVYGEKQIDEHALGSVFIFSRQFNTLDKNARAYGQIIYSSLLNIGEHIGVPAYVKIIDRQAPDVQQRVRDFLWYPAWRAEHKQNSGELESVYPGLFPKSYKFGRDDPIFANEVPHLPVVLSPRVRAMIVQADLAAIRTQLALYKAANGAYPSTDQGLVALVVKPQSLPSPSRWTQLFYAVPKDPWGNEYFYLCPGRTNPTGYDLFSTGPDGKAYTTDDDWGE
jgi:type II secretion system protein G